MANHKKYRIKLTEDERSIFREVIQRKRGRQNVAAWKVQRAICPNVSSDICCSAQCAR